MIPSRLNSPWVGRRPNSDAWAAGTRIDPQVSEPQPIGAKLAATAAPVPPLEPPGQRCSSTAGSHRNSPRAIRGAFSSVGPTGARSPARERSPRQLEPCGDAAVSELIGQGRPQDFPARAVVAQRRRPRRHIASQP
jgi:hypothetical protein